MAYAMTKQGSLDNCITYEFICDTTADMNAIENRYRTIGTVAIVLQGNSGLEVYISGSDKQWNSLSSIGGSSGAGSAAGLAIHICGQNEVNEGLPNVSEPDETTIYLVPAEDEQSGNLYDEYIYVDGDWEKFGSGGTIDLSAYAPIESPVFTSSISMGRVGDIGANSVAVGLDVTASDQYSHAEGYYTAASNEAAHAEGYNSNASGYASHAEGCDTNATDDYTHAEGYSVTASGYASHAEGYCTKASNESSHAEGSDTIASGYYSHAEGYGGTNYGALGQADHVEGYQTKANSGTGSNCGAHAEGNRTQATADAAHAEGNSTIASGAHSHAEGVNTIASGGNSHAEGYGASGKGALGKADHSEGYKTLANSGTTVADYGAHAEGYQTVSKSRGSHAEGGKGSSDTWTYGGTTYTYGATGQYSHSEGYNTTASANSAHAEGNGTFAKGIYSHAEGYNSKATSDGSHAEGNSTLASAYYSHAEGQYTTASSQASHAEGGQTTASAYYSHAEGYYTTASGYYSHAEGQSTTASGDNSHAEGYYTKAAGKAQHVSGQYNKLDSGVAIDISTITEEYNPDKGWYNEGSVVVYNNTKYVAHANAPTKHQPPQYETMNWHSWTGTPTGTEPEWEPQSYAAGTIVKVTTNGTVAYYQNHNAINSISQYPSDSTTYWHSQAVGKYTAPLYLEIVGNGSAYTEGRNVRTLDVDGNAQYAGNITAAGGTLTLGSGNNAVSITAAQLETLLSLANATGVSF